MPRSTRQARMCCLRGGRMGVSTARSESPSRIGTELTLWHLSPRRNRASIRRRGLEPRTRTLFGPRLFLWPKLPSKRDVQHIAARHRVDPADLDLYSVPVPTGTKLMAWYGYLSVADTLESVLLTTNEV